MRFTTSTGVLRRGFAASLVVCAGCTGLPPAEQITIPTVELTSTAFFPQNTNQCGPAALTTVLRSSGVAADYQRVVERIFLPERGGSLQLEILAAARAFDRLPVRIPGTAAAIAAQLELDRPVLVMQNLGFSALPIWHYAVVVGYLAGSDEFVLRSGPEKRLLMSRAKFMRTWSRADGWGVVLFQAAQPIAGVDAEAYLTEAVALESLGRYNAARDAYAQMLMRWPDLTIAALGAANSMRGLGDLKAARTAYQRLLAINPENIPARNNLAQTLAEIGCVESALNVIKAAPASSASRRLYSRLAVTRQEIESGAIAATTDRIPPKNCEIQGM